MPGRSTPQITKAAVNNTVSNSSTEQNNFDSTNDKKFRKMHTVRFMHNSGNDTFTSTLSSNVSEQSDLNQDNNNNNTNSSNQAYHNKTSNGASSRQHVILHLILIIVD